MSCACDLPECPVAATELARKLSESFVGEMQGRVTHAICKLVGVRAAALEQDIEQIVNAIRMEYLAERWARVKLDSLAVPSTTTNAPGGDA